MGIGDGFISINPGPSKPVVPLNPIVPPNHPPIVVGPVDPIYEPVTPGGHWVIVWKEKVDMPFVYFDAISCSGTIIEEHRTEHKIRTNEMTGDYDGTSQTGIQHCYYGDTVKNKDIVTVLGGTVCECTSFSDNAFRNCDELTCVNISSITTIGNYSFDNCDILKYALIPELKAVPSHAFNNCKTLRWAEIQQITSIADMAFNNCSSLIQATIPNVISIGSKAFNNCYSLAAIDFGTWLEDVTTVNLNTFDGSFMPISCYVPPELFDTWTADPTWLQLVTAGKVEIISRPPPVERFTVKFFVDSRQYGNIQYICKGNAAIKPDNPIKEGYIFQRWDKDDEILGNVTENLDVNAVFVPSAYYTVTFKDWDDSVISSKEILCGSPVTYPQHPNSRPDYDANGWQPTAITSMPTHDIDVSALYKIKQYDVKFIDGAPRADFIDGSRYSKKYDIHTNVTYPEVSCLPGYTWSCDPESIVDLTTDTSVYLQSHGKGQTMLGISLSGDISSKRLRLNGHEHIINNPEYQLVDKGNGISALTLYAEDLLDGSEKLTNAESAFVDLNGQLLSIDYINYTNLTSIDDIANGCYSLTEMSLAELTAIQTAKRMFKDCTKLTNLSIPDNQTIIERVGDQDAFANCTSLSTIRYLGKLSSYQTNDILTENIGEFNEIISVDVDRFETHSKVIGGKYGMNTKHLITTADNVKQMYFDTSRLPGSQSGIKNNIKYFEAGYKIGSLPAPILNGYQPIANGWVYDDNTRVLNVDIHENDVTCYINMKPTTYYISYHTNDGTINQPIVNTYTIDDTITMPTDVTRTNYQFDGWFDNSSLTGEPIVEILSGNTGNVDVYAKWTLNQHTVTVKINTETYDAEGAHISIDDPTACTIKLGPTVPTLIKVDGTIESDPKTQINNYIRSGTKLCVPVDSLPTYQTTWGDTTPTRYTTYDPAEESRPSFQGYFYEGNKPVDGEATILKMTDYVRMTTEDTTIPEKITES